eukprot:scaffold94671_cov53-Cyclotella_meneghiniana.AAC.6
MSTTDLTFDVENSNSSTGSWTENASQIMNHGNKNPLHFTLHKGGGPILLTPRTSSLDEGQHIDPLHHRPLQQNNCPHLTGIKPYVKAIIVEVATTF